MQLILSRTTCKQLRTCVNIFPHKDVIESYLMNHSFLRKEISLNVRYSTTKMRTKMQVHQKKHTFLEQRILEGSLFIKKNIIDNDVQTKLI